MAPAVAPTHDRRSGGSKSRRCPDVVACTNAIMQRWGFTAATASCWTGCWPGTKRTLLHALRPYERHDNAYDPNRGISTARPRQSLPEPISNPATITHLSLHRRDRPGGIIHEYEHAGCRATCADGILGTRAAAVLDPTFSGPPAKGYARTQYGDERPANIGKCLTLRVHRSAPRCCVVAAMT
jgi:hypothetical protein